MTSRLLAVAIFAVMIAEVVWSADVKPFRVKPTVVVFKFLEAVEVGAKDYLTYIDVDLFFESNKDRFRGCTSKQVGKYMEELIALPTRHNPPLQGRFTERNEYRVVEEIVNYETASVLLVKRTAGEKILEVKFGLVAKADQWIIANMNGYFDKYIAEACAKAMSDAKAGRR